MIGLERERVIVARQRLIEPVQLLQHNAVVVESLRIVGLDADSFAKSGMRFLELALVP